MKRLITTSAAGWSLFGLLALAQAAGPATIIQVDPASPGGVFEGLGGVSAGASSRLLFDYPEPQRSEILDYLFKPHYGASLHHLKVEIGGDVNSTDGVEPSHMHTRADEDYHRGYEWWLMKEAKKRNPDILLDCLAWGAPAWIGEGSFYSQDMADYIVKFIKGAKRVHGLDIDFTGIWNEKSYDIAWIKLLRTTLNNAGLRHVGIIVADQCGEIWKIADNINRDPGLKSAAFAIGVHYPRSASTPGAIQSGKPLWSSEDGPWSGEWNAASAGSHTPLQVTYNRNYIVGKMTKTEIWSPITSYYDNLPLPGSGLMRANTPWSGHYDLQPALWVTAHTTQFTGPRWKYLDSACLLLPGTGSVVALQSPDARDYSLIIETSDARVPHSLTFQLKGGLASRALHVWRTSSHEQFQRLPEITPRENRFTITVDPQSVYSLTTTSGQRKGGAIPPPPAAFPADYHEDFAAYVPGASPRYWSDIAGVFEVVKRSDGKGKALRQVIDRKGIEWRPNATPETLCGEVSWRNYTVSADALIEKSGFVSLLGRFAAEDAFYRVNVADRGHWELMAGKTRLASGHVSYAANTWHALKLGFHDNTIRAEIDGVEVAHVDDKRVDHGNAGIGCGWHGAQFANIKIQSQTEAEDRPRGKPATASTQRPNAGDLLARLPSIGGQTLSPQPR